MLIFSNYFNLIVFFTMIPIVYLLRIILNKPNIMVKSL